ncbi:hypothetical protein [Aquabacter cavernae]|uniref:hypothetical protein n=1 Tax=Aquabacter cavernae TaxID=2496029 RepID=UPI000F8F5C3F|nr:hypothetical protein [Aquabacter cavernae]
MAGLVAALVCTAVSHKAQAHHPVDPATLVANGLPIPALTHGEMAVVSRHAAVIREMADDQGRTDPTFRRLANFAALQRTYCLWGLVPGSLADEESPFNGCLHSYLAALRALLVHMQDMPGAAQQAPLLVRQIDQEMVASEAAASLCQHSAEIFSTGHVIIPDWRDVLRHPPSILALAGVACAAAAAAVAASAFGRTPRPPAA